MYGHLLSGTVDQISQPLHTHSLMTYCGQTLTGYAYIYITYKRCHFVLLLGARIEEVMPLTRRFLLLMLGGIMYVPTIQDIDNVLRKL